MSEYQYAFQLGRLLGEGKRPGALVEHIAAVGFSPRYGARPLQRAIEQHVVSALSRLLIESPQVTGTLVCDVGEAGVRVSSL